MKGRQKNSSDSNQNLKFGIVHAGTAEVLRSILSDPRAVEETCRVAARLGHPYFVVGQKTAKTKICREYNVPAK